MATAFISYRHISPDQDLAAGLAEYLEQQGVSCFRDTKIRLGEKWAATIERELRTCQFLVVLLSAESILSDMVRHEVKLAHEWKKHILPIRVNYNGALPYDLGSYLDVIQYTIWRTGEPLEPICERALDGIRGRWTEQNVGPSPEGLRRLGEVTELNGAPLPSSDPRLEMGGPETGGIKLQSRFYVRRADDDRVEYMVANQVKLF